MSDTIALFQLVLKVPMKGRENDKTTDAIKFSSWERNKTAKKLKLINYSVFGAVA